MTAKSRKRDLRTRVSLTTFDQVRRYSAAHAITQYAAAERLVLQGLDAANATAATDDAMRATLDQLAARVEQLTALVDRSLFGAMMGYAYARHIALANLDAEQRQALDLATTKAAERAHQRQRAKALGGDNDAT